MRIKAVLFDLHGTLVYVKNPVSDEEASMLLLNRGYEVSPQQFKAAWAFVAFIDYPKYGYANWKSYLTRVLMKLEVKVDAETLKELEKTFVKSEYSLYPDAAEAVAKAKNRGLQTAIVTTIARFKFQEAIEPIESLFDFICTGYEAKCDKSNPKMYRTILQTLSLKPEEAIVIGDDIQYDILLPKRIGLHAILLDREMKNQGSTAPDAIAKDLRAAIELLNKST